MALLAKSPAPPPAAKKKKGAAPVADSREDARERNGALAKIGASLAGGSIRPARQVFKVVSAVPTILPHVDAKLRVGGWPTNRISLVHGPSHEGKTKLLSALGLSFLMRGHVYVHLDVERTTPITWIEQMFGAFADSPLFFASHPANYEEARADVLRFATKIADLKAKGSLPPDTTCLFGLDSLKKLTPKGFFDKVVAAENAEAADKAAATGRKSKAKDKGFDGARGRGGQIKARLTSAWLDELVPLLDDTGCAMLFIAREHKKVDAGQWEDDYVVGGGGDLFFDSSIACRVERAWNYGPGPDDKPKPVLGEKHWCGIKKSKIASKGEEKVVYAQFNTSNGALVPEGFDRARDVVALADEAGVTKKVEGGWIVWHKRKFHGENQAVKRLTAEPLLLEELERESRAAYAATGGG